MSSGATSELLLYLVKKLNVSLELDENASKIDLKNDVITNKLLLTLKENVINLPQLTLV